MVLYTFQVVLHVTFFSLTVKPQTVSILTKEKHVSADKRYEVECRTSGSRPDAVITWWKGSRPVKRLAKNVSRFVSCPFIVYPEDLLMRIFGRFYGVE